MDSNPVILTQIDQAKVEGLALAKSDASGMTFFAVTDAYDPQVPSIRPKVQLLVAGFAISARSMTSRCTNSICGDIDRGGQNSNCFEGRNDEKPEMAADSNEAEFRALVRTERERHNCVGKPQRPLG